MTLCEHLQKVIHEFDGPFAEGIGINRETHKIINLGPTVTMYHLTPSGKGIASKGRETWIVDYCPFCGQKVERES